MGAALSLAISIGTPLVGGILGSVYTMKEVKGWYTTLKKPRWTPPNWLFGPAWTFLYTCIGGASWLVWKQGGWAQQALPLSVYVGQLALNMAWSPLFFGAHEMGLAFVDLLGMWGGAAACIPLFHKVNPLAGYLMVPYLAWVSYAGALNLNIWMNNMQQGKLTGKHSSS